MNWLSQKRKVAKLEEQLSDKRTELTSLRQQFQQNLGDTLGRTDVLIWVFSVGMLWQMNQKPGESRSEGMRLTLSNLTKYSLFAMRILGLRF